MFLVFGNTELMNIAILIALAIYSNQKNMYFARDLFLITLIYCTVYRVLMRRILSFHYENNMTYILSVILLIALIILTMQFRGY